jgi:WD40 repeat protein
MPYFLAIAAMGMSDNKLRVWNWANNSTLLTLPGTFSPPTMVEFLSNGLLAAAATSSNTTLWNITTGTGLTLNAQNYALEGLSNGNLATTGSSNFIQIWNPLTGVLIYQVNVGKTQFALKQTSTANLLASGSNDNKIYLWDIYTLTLVSTLSGHAGIVNRLDLTPSGLLVSASADNTVKLWNITQTTALSSVSLPATITALKVASPTQLVVGLNAAYVRLVNNNNNVLTLGAQVNLPNPSTTVQDLKVTSQSVVLVGNADGSVAFMNLNTSSFNQSLIPVNSSVKPNTFDIIGITLGL